MRLLKLGKRFRIQEDLLDSKVRSTEGGQSYFGRREATIKLAKK